MEFRTDPRKLRLVPASCLSYYRDQEKAKLTNCLLEIIPKRSVGYFSPSYELSIFLRKNQRSP